MVVGVTPEFPNAGSRQARVVLADKLIDGASNTFRVRLELPNPGLTIPAGLRCKVDLSSVAPTNSPATQRSLATQQVTLPRTQDGLTLRLDSSMPLRSPPKP